ncbi:MAG TPA: non-ribosomal peptide synthase/polyketide synthase, partial [Longimicrobiaceae bacterium]|nr:non-ribosomal peptide synthase/polyketide synthase [Longimicrobiaceae bacterium]
MDNVESVYPLSPMQEAILLHELSAGAAGRYVEQVSWTVRGPFDPVAFARAWNRAVARHPALRSLFFWEGLDAPLQVVRARAEMPIEALDWRGVEAAEREPRLAELRAEVRRAGFDLSAAPPLRLIQVRTADDEHRFVWSYHHLLLDGWSVTLLLREVLAAYDVLCRSEEPATAPAPSLGAYHVWLQGRSAEEIEAFWRAELAGFDAPTRLPGPPVRTAAGDGSTDSRTLLLEPVLVESLRAAARRHRVTLHTLLQGAWAVLLGRYAGERDVVFGGLSNGRPAGLSGADAMLGLFINAVPVRARVTPGEPLGAWLRAQQAAQVRARPFEHVSPARVRAWSEIPAGERLFDTLFIFQDLPDSGFEGARVGGQEVRDFRRHEAEAWLGYAALLEAGTAGDGMELTLRYDGAVDAALFARAPGHLRALLEAMAGPDDPPVDGLPLLAGAERAQVLSEWNDTTTAFDGPATLHGLFEAQARNTPDAPALTFEGETLAFRELERRTASLADRLQEAGVGPETRVGVLMERSAELVVALLGVLRAGAAYVPLDPGYPAERLAYMLVDSAVPLLVTQPHLAGLLPEFTGERVVVEPAPTLRAGEAAEQGPAGPLDPDHLAYVIYTSGSTGRPKGAMNAHRGIVNRLLWMQEEYGLTPDDVVLQKTPFSFDVSVWEFFWPLLAGARLVIARPEGHRDPVYLSELIEREGVTTLHFVPSMLQAFLEGGEPQRCRSVRRVVCSGEALPGTLRDRFFERLPWAELHNLYGPTEAAVDVTSHACERGRPVVPIGRPVANTRVYVLDAGMEALPAGAAGELYLGGVQVGRGYLGQPGLTAERFVPDPFGGERGARLYRTGDRVRWLAEGELEYLGRLDGQVKLRGHRIETGEVEAALGTHPAVREACVVVRDDLPGGPRLVGYVVPREAVEVSAEELRIYLRERLPEPMVPGAFVLLERLPLTPSGKLDRRALPAPDPSASPGAYVAPRGEVEEILARVWAETLGVERVGVLDNFFETGGDSILSIQAVARARRAGVRVTPRQMFEQPTIAALARVALTGAGADGGEGRAAGTGAPDPAALERLEASGGEVEDAYPLTPMQEGMLFHAIYEEGGSAYLGQFVFDLSGELNADAFGRAWQAVAARHPALRTGFIWEGEGGALQVVRREAHVPLERQDWRGLDGGEVDARASAFLRDDRARGFDLGRAPLMRLTLLRTGDREHRLIWTHHHLVLDGWSLALVYRDVIAAYEALTAGRDPGLTAGPAYRPYVEWLLTRDAEAADRFWSAELADFEAATPLGIDRPAAPLAAGEPRYAGIRLRLEEGETVALQRLATSRGLTVATVLQGAWALLLARYSGEEEVLFGVTVAGRPAELEGIDEGVGLFINTLPVRVPVPAGRGAGEWLRELQERTARLRDFEHTPLAQAQRRSGVPAGEPLFESILVFQNYPLRDVQTDGEHGLRLSARGRTEQTGYPLTLEVQPGERMELAVEYDRARFGVSAVERLLEHLRRILADLATDPSRPLDAVSPLAAGERARLLAAASSGAAAPAPRCLHQLFAEQAEQRPEATALLFRGQAVSYGELHRRSDALARRLAALGVGPDVRVGICLERSPELVVGLLGILKAGGAYLPLDPRFPAERLAFMLADAEAPVLLAGSATVGRFPEYAGRVVLAPFAADADPGPFAPVVPATPEHLAYVIYTSGSTGTPKGTEVPHRAVPGFFRGAEYVRFDREQVLFQYSSVSWDVLTLELWPALLTGATCVLYSGEGSEPAELAAEAAAGGVTTLWLTAAYFNLVVDSCPALLDGVRQVMVGGEALSVPHVRRALEAHPGLRVVNGYGPSECTVFATCYPVPAGFDGTAVPIGAPVGDRRVYLLDRGFEPVPVGVAGELFVGGPAVARGYLGRPALTAEKFVPDPFGEPGARFYRTGDLARWREDGTLEFVGRVDFQVKVRGFRVEPGEVEAALLEHPAVREAAVVAREDRPGERRLAAYLVVAEDSPPAAELRAWLRERLPEYMIPSAFVALERMPLTPNGKLDRRALPAPEVAPAPEEGVAPRTHAEEVLARVWAEVLRRDAVGVHDDFFELGGDSILSIQIVARARAAGLHLTPRQLFENPTVAGLAAVAGARPGRGAEQGPVTGEVPLTPIQHWLFEQELPDPDYWNMSLLLAPAERLDAAALESALSHLAAHHDALRLRFHQTGSGWRQENAPAGAGVPVETIDLSSLPETERAAAIEREGVRVQRSLSLAEGPLFRTALFELGGDGRQRLLLAVHHLVLDGVSWRVLLEDLGTALGQIARGVAPSLPPKTTSFRAWALRLAEHARRGGFDAELPYWTDPSRAGVSPIPVDFAEGEAAVPEPRTLSVELDEAETRALLRDVPRAYRTQINDALLAALARALGEWSGDPRVLVELEGHGREEHLLEGTDLSRTVGWFTTLYPVVLDAGRGDSPGEGLKRIKEQLRGVPERGIGYGALRYLSADPEVRARLAALPRARVAFNYLGQLDAGGAGGALFALAPESIGPAVAPGGRGLHLLTVNAMVEGGCLRAAWSYDATAHRPDTVRRIADAFLAGLRALVAHCASPDAGGYTPSDFPLAGLDQAGLNRLLGRERGIEDVYPLTPMQEGMLFHSLYEEGSAYLGQFRFDLAGPLDVAAFRAAWQGVLDRHTALRTGLAWEGVDRPLQIVRQRVELPFEEHDWRGVDPAEREVRMQAFLRADRARRFDLGSPPLTRVTLFRLEDDRHHFVWTHHHLVLDGWSLSLVYRDVVAGYGARLLGRAPEPSRDRPYREYVAWLLGRDDRGAEDFWRDALDGAPVPTPFGVDHPTGAASEEGEAVLLRTMDEGVSAAVREAAARYGLTANTLVQGAWALLLSRYSGEEDVVFGATVSGRPAELEGAGEMVGLFINTLPVRVQVAPEQRILPWLRALQARQAELREHEHTPLVQVQRWSGVAAGERLFESILVFQNYPLEDAVVGGAHGLRVETRGGIEEGGFPLTLSVTPGERLGVKAEYALRRFDAATVERMLEHLETVLDALARHPEGRVGDIALVGEAERRRLLGELNGPRAAFPRDARIHDPIAARAAEVPDAVAVVQGARSLTYAEFESEASRFACRLRALGVGPEARVALVLDRSPELAVAVLAVLRAGGAFVPLDPEYPAERLAFMLEDSGAAVVVTLAGLRERLPETGATVLCIDTPVPSNEPTEPVESGADAENLAYAVYTSGSTGRPKAAMVSHRSLVAYAQAMSRELRLAGDDRVLQFASPGFDVVIEELFPAWATGAAVVFPEGELLASPAELMRTVEAQGVTGFELPTAYWHECVRQLAEDGLCLPACVRWVIVGGERVLPERLRQWAGLGVPLVHVFGLTETTVTNTALRLEAGDDGSGWDHLPVGRPTENTRVYVLDCAGQPAPIGVPGELYVGGEGVTRGYLGRPELTAERYLPDPFGEPGARMYRTGDRVRRLADGNLEFLGRIDQQVKVRGFRIEPAEVEAALASHPAVAEAAVVVRDTGDGDRRLVAYLVPAEGLPSVAELRDHVARRLPAYMVPSVFVLLDRLPLTRHGKLDRRALPDPEDGLRAEDAPYEAPGTAAERELAAVWAEVLRVERVGIHDNFFELGGDSILSIQVVSRARRVGVHLTPRQLFEHPTVAALARAAGVAGAEAEQGEVAGEVETTPVQRWFFEQEPPEPHHWNMPLLLTLRERLDAAALERALSRLVAHHDALRLRFRETDGGWRQTNAPAGEAVPLPTIDLSALPEGRHPAAIERAGARLQRSLELAEGPLLRAALFHRGVGSGQRLLLAVHHLVVDGVSWRVLLEDLETAYGQMARGEAVVLPPKTTSFRAWAGRLAEHTRAGGFDAELPFWTDPRWGEAAVLPVDFAEGTPTLATVREVSVSLGAEETLALLHEVPRAYRTQVNDVLLTALARSLAAWTGSPRVLVELEGHGREELFADVDLSRTVGWFTTLFPVLLDVGEDPSPGAALKHVKERLREVPNRGIGFGALRYLSADPELRARLAALPRPRVAFNYLGRLDAAGAGFFALAPEAIGPWASPEGRAPHLLAVNAAVEEGRLRIAVSFSEAAHRRETVEGVAERLRAELRALIAHCASLDAGGCTPSDFPLAGLDQAALDRLVGAGRDVEDVYPLTPMQEGMLFHTLMQPGGGAYVAQLQLRLLGKLDSAAFDRAWREVTARHMALRTGFAWEGIDRPLQVVRREVELEIRREDWSGAPTGAGEERMRAFLREDRARGFDPARPPLMRLALFRTGPEEHELVWTHHQMMVDGWSVPLIFGEVAALYGAHSGGRLPELIPVRPYREYTAWLQRQDPARAEHFWREALAGFTASTPFGVDRTSTRPADPERRYPQLGHALSAEDTGPLLAVSRRYGVTANTLVQGAWALLLSRYSGEQDVVFGTTVSGRPAEVEGVEEMVGLFINTLPLRARTAPDDRVAPWLRGLQERNLELREFEHTPLAQVQRWSGIPAGEPLFESILVFQNYPVADRLGEGEHGLRMEMRGEEEQADYPLTLNARIRGGLSIQAEYDGHRFEAAAVSRMLEQMGTLLRGMAASPEGRVADLPLLSPVERLEVLAESRGPASPHPREACIHHRFAARAERTPDAPAVIAEGVVLSYRELDARSSRLARHLRAKGVGSETAVALCVERTAEMAVGILAILKAGGVWVPLDPAYPAERLRYVLDDSGAAVLLADAATAGRLPRHPATVLLDSAAEAVGEYDDAPVEGGALPGNLAYLIYTSGSTGRPKGVAVEHRSLVGYALDLADRLELRPTDRFLQFASPGFDVVVEEIFPAWASGAAVVLSRADLFSPDELLRVIAEEGVTCLELPTAYWHEWVRGLAEDGARLPASVRCVIVGGERVLPERLR